MGDFKEIFDIEVHCWCLGLSKSPEKLDCAVLHRVIKEFTPIVREAIQNLYVFDLVDTARKFILASKCKASEREIAFHILSLIPEPSSLNKDQQNVLHQIVENLEKKHPGAFERLEKKWKTSSREWKAENNFDSDIGFAGLVVPVAK